jgi:hypothetical protein
MQCKGRKEGRNLKMIDSSQKDTLLQEEEAWEKNWGEGFTSATTTSGKFKITKPGLCIAVYLPLHQEPWSVLPSLLPSPSVKMFEPARTTKFPDDQSSKIALKEEAEAEEEDGVDALGIGVQKRRRRKRWCWCFRVWGSEEKEKKKTVSML